LEAFKSVPAAANIEVSRPARHWEYGLQSAQVFSEFSMQQRTKWNKSFPWDGHFEGYVFSDYQLVSSEARDTVYLVSFV